MGQSQALTPEQERYAKAIISTTRELLLEEFGEHHPTLLECFTFGLEVGMAAGLDFPDDARRLLAIAAPDTERRELTQDAQDFFEEALG
jgi:hypothetical protein